MFKIPERIVTKLNDLGDAKRDAEPPKLFIVAGIEGNCDTFNDLADKLGKQNVQVYGIQFARSVPSQTVEAMAERFLDEIEDFLKHESGTTQIYASSRRIYLAGYSFGGCVAIEMCRQLEDRQKRSHGSSQQEQLEILNLILFESSHIFFRIGVHSYGKMFGFQVPTDNFFSHSFMYASSLTVFFSFMVGQSSADFKKHLYTELNKTKSIDDAISRAFEYSRENSLYTFDKEEQQDLRVYLKLLLDKSNAATMYKFRPDEDGKARLQVPVTLVRSRKFMYDKMDEGLTILDPVSQQERPFRIDHNDYSLPEIAHNLVVFVAQRGNHWSFLVESSEEIMHFLVTNVMKTGSKTMKSKL